MAVTSEPYVAQTRPDNWLARLFDNKAFLITICMLPAVGLLVLFLTYPLGLGVWLAFTDTRIGRAGEFIGFFNYELLFTDRVFWMAVWWTVFYTVFATIFKFALGLWLALLLNHYVPFKSVVRAIILVPWIVPTVLSAIAFWWIYDPQFSIISYVLVDVLGWRETYIDFLGDPWNARWSLIAANVWRGIPFVAICLLAGLQTISPSLYEAAMLDGATPWQRFVHVTVTDFQLVYAITRGGPVNSTHLMATLAFQRAIPGGQLGEGAAIAVAMIPFLIAATFFSYFALARRKWQQGGDDD